MKRKHGGWQKVGQMLSGTAIKAWYKKHVRRRNRRAARVNPEATDKKLNPWDID